MRVSFCLIAYVCILAIFGMNKIVASNSGSWGIALEINPNYQYAVEIESILHYPERSVIVINLNKTRECARPQLIGRMLGSMVTTLVWEKTPDQQYMNASQSDKIIGNYHAPVPGKYFLEIIATTCIDIQFSTNVKDVCLVEPSQHRLTHDGLFINVPPLPMQKNEGMVIGHWYDATGNATHVPLYTRLQPQNCRGESDGLDRCRKATDLARFDPYLFKFSNRVDLNMLLEGESGKVCFVGASHSQMLVKHSQDVVALLNESIRTNIQFENAYIQYISHLTEGYIISKIISMNCTKIIVGICQWDLGFPQGFPTSFLDYEEGLNLSLYLMMRIFPPHVHVFYRNCQ